MKPFLFPWLLLIAACSLAGGARGQDVRLFGSAAELDLHSDSGGAFVYAINFGANESISLQGLTFTPDTEIHDLQLQGDLAIEQWESPNTFGSSALNTLMHSMRQAAYPADLSFQLTELDPDSAHKLQLFFAEKCCLRGFDILINDEVVIPNFSAQQLGGNHPQRAALATINVPPGVSSIALALRGKPLLFPDPSPVIQAATLERLGTRDRFSEGPATLRVFPETDAPNPRATNRLQPSGRAAQPYLGPSDPCLGRR